MKKLIIILLTGLSTGSGWSQDLLGFESITRIDIIDYKNAEAQALEAANYLFSTAIDSFKAEREKAITFMLIWMDGTPDYVFYIDDNVNFFTRSQNNLLAIFLAGLTKSSLENPGLSQNPKELKYRAIHLFVDYCNNPSNHIKPYRELEQLIKANEKERLRNYVENGS